MEHSTLPLWTFEQVGVLAILAGGLLAAFSAKKPSRLASWESAYLVLIVGLFQAIIGVSLHYTSADPAVWLLTLAFVTYNVGSAGTLAGTALKGHKYHRLFVDVGGALFVISMVSLLVLVHQAALSWQLVVFYVIVITILITMPIGLTLSRRHETTKQKS